jgi:dihydroxy-acid dehydratase
MGGSTNTVLHLLAVAHEAGVDFTMQDIDRLSRITPNLCKVAPSSAYHVEDVNRAGGILGIMAELDRTGLLDASVKRIDGGTLKEALARHDITKSGITEEVLKKYRSAPGGGRNLILGSQEKYYAETDTNRKSGCIRDVAHAYNQDGGLAVLYGNIARNGSIIKTAGVDPSLWHFTGRARVFDSQEEACNGILSDKVMPGDVVVIRYEGPKGGPGMQEMLYPTSYLKSLKLDKQCALITDGRFSGGTAGLSVGHISPEAAAGGEIALICDGDLIKMDIPGRTINLMVSDDELATRRSRENSKGEKAWKPAQRQRHVSPALRAYASMVSSADLGAVRILKE